MGSFGVKHYGICEMYLLQGISKNTIISNNNNTKHETKHKYCVRIHVKNKFAIFTKRPTTNIHNYISIYRPGSFQMPDIILQIDIVKKTRI